MSQCREAPSAAPGTFQPWSQSASLPFAGGWWWIRHLLAGCPSHHFPDRVTSEVTKAELRVQVWRPRVSVSSLKAGAWAHVISVVSVKARGFDKQ